MAHARDCPSSALAEDAALPCACVPFVLHVFVACAVCRAPLELERTPLP